MCTVTDILLQYEILKLVQQCVSILLCIWSAGWDSKANFTLYIVLSRVPSVGYKVNLGIVEKINLTRTSFFYTNLYASIFYF